MNHGIDFIKQTVWSPDSTKVAIYYDKEIYVLFESGYYKKTSISGEGSRITLRWWGNDKVIFCYGKLYIWDIVRDELSKHEVHVYDFDIYGDMILYTDSYNAYRYNLVTRDKTIAINSDIIDRKKEYNIDDGEANRILDIHTNKSGEKVYLGYFCCVGYYDWYIYDFKTKEKLNISDIITQRENIDRAGYGIEFLALSKDKGMAYISGINLVPNGYVAKKYCFSLNEFEIEELEIDDNIIILEGIKVNIDIWLDIDEVDNCGVLLSPDRKKELYTRNGIISIIYLNYDIDVTAVESKS